MIGYGPLREWICMWMIKNKIGIEPWVNGKELQIYLSLLFKRKIRGFGTPLYVEGDPVDSRFYLSNFKLLLP